MITKFTNHVTPRKNPLIARYLFLERRQKTDETFENFVTETRNLVKDCEYDKPEEMVRDIIVCGILSSSIREKLLDKGAALTMEEAIDIAITHETTQTHLRSMSNKSSSVDTIKEKKAGMTIIQRKNQNSMKNCAENVDDLTEHHLKIAQQQEQHA